MAYATNWRRWVHADEAACNYDANATDEGDCSYAETNLDCNGACINDADGDGVCDEFEVVGCTDVDACNYDDAATDDGACEYPEPMFDCDGNCLNDADGDGICDEVAIAGCMDDTACNYNAEAEEDDGSCEYPAKGTIATATRCPLEASMRCPTCRCSPTQ